MSNWNPSPEYLAARELDAKIETEVFGRPVTMDWPCGVDFESGELRASQTNPAKYPRLYNERHPVVQTDNCVYCVPEYSGNMAAAWVMVEEMNRRREAGECGAYWWNFWANGAASRVWQKPAAEAAKMMCEAALIACEPQKSLVDSFKELGELMKDADWSALEED